MYALKNKVHPQTDKISTQIKLIITDFSICENQLNQTHVCPFFTL